MGYKLKNPSKGITRESCVNYNANYVPPVEARTECPLYKEPQIGSKKLADHKAICSGYYTVQNPKVKTIQSECATHQQPAETSLYFSAGQQITADKINQFVDEIQQERARRGQSQSAELVDVSSGTIARPNALQKIYDVINSMQAFSQENRPYTGQIIAAASPTTALNTLKTLMSECVCYTDCGGYSICGCYGHCNNY